MSEQKAQIARCHVHGGNPISTKLLHRHHVVPQGYGGPDTEANTVWICASCHDLLHRMAHFVLSKKQGIAQDLASQHLPNSPAARQRLWKLTASAANAMQTHIPEAGESSEEILMSLSVPRALHHRLKTLAQDHFHAKSGRRVGLYRYCVEVLKKHVEVKMMKSGAKEEELYGGPSVEASEPEEEPRTVMHELFKF